MLGDIDWLEEELAEASKMIERLKKDVKWWCDRFLLEGCGSMLDGARVYSIGDRRSFT